MDNKLHGFLTDDLREMASCSETWQLTLRAWTKHMRFLNITNNTLPSRSSPNRNIKASEKQISKPLYAERLQGKREIKIPASSCRWSAKALKLLTQAHYNGTHYYQWLHLLSALSLFLAWWKSSNWNMQSFTSQSLTGNAALSGCRLHPIDLSRSILKQFYLIVLATFIFKVLLKHNFFYLSPEFHFWIIFLKNFFK